MPHAAPSQHTIQPSSGLSQGDAPYIDALRRLASADWQHIHVPAHHGRAENAPGIASFMGEQALRMDKPMLFSGIDQESWRMIDPARPTPLARSLVLAAEAWGARRAWFLTNGASQGNHIATMAARALGREILVQRGVHSSVVDGIAHSGLDAHFVQGAVDTELGSSHGLTPSQVDTALSTHPGSTAVYITSPSYFGAVSDVAGIADVAHARGVPLIVDEAWGAHFGFHPELPVNAVRLGADLVVSSTHKGGGSLTQSAMLFVGDGPFADRLEELVDRMHRSYQSTSSSALLMASLDEARRRLAVDGESLIGHALRDADAIRRGIRAGGRFRDATADIRSSAGTVDHDPFKIVIDTRTGGIPGGEAHHRLIRDHGVVVELSTHSAILLLVGATSRTDVDRFLTALHALPELPGSPGGPRRLPPIAPLAMSVQDAFLGATEIVPWEDGVGRVSADALAAYPPGIPNVLPGEPLTREVLDFLRATAADASGYVRGAVDTRVDRVRVVAP
jgi:arginine/lysine/ornithine decarboxylase